MMRGKVLGGSSSINALAHTILERKVSSHGQAIIGLIGAIRGLMESPNPQSRPIGFTADLGKGRKG